MSQSYNVNLTKHKVGDLVMCVEPDDYESMDMPILGYISEITPGLQKGYKEYYVLWNDEDELMSYDSGSIHRYKQLLVETLEGYTNEEEARY